MEDYVEVTDEPVNTCGPDSGCRFVERSEDGERGENLRLDALDKQDSEYIYESSDHDEPYEYNSDDGIVEDRSAETESSLQHQSAASGDAHYQTWLRTVQLSFQKYAGTEQDPPEVLRLLSEISEDAGENGARLLDGYRNGLTHLEHIAGTGCNSTIGYNGCHISVEEMYGCSTSQCLSAKRSLSKWTPEADDQDFELHGDYFLSGLNDDISEGDYGTHYAQPMYWPLRHGFIITSPKNILRQVSFTLTCAQIGELLWGVLISHDFRVVNHLKTPPCRSIRPALIFFCAFRENALVALT